MRSLCLTPVGKRSARDIPEKHLAHHAYQQGNLETEILLLNLEVVNDRMDFILEICPTGLSEFQVELKGVNNAENLQRIPFILLLHIREV